MHERKDLSDKVISRTDSFLIQFLRRTGCRALGDSVPDGNVPRTPESPSATRPPPKRISRSGHDSLIVRTKRSA
jgi:hypothetical protein